MICSCTKVDAKVSGSLAPEELDAIDFGDKVIIPEDKKKDAFPIPWGFLVSFSKQNLQCAQERPKTFLAAQKTVPFCQFPAVRKKTPICSFLEKKVKTNNIFFQNNSQDLCFIDWLVGVGIELPLPTQWNI